MKVALYARVSSERQAEKDLSISSQLKALREYAKRNECEVYHEFVDEAESARTANRPAFQEMIALARQKPRPFEVILVWKLSRFARNREDSILYKSLLRKRGIQVVSVSENIDDSASGKLLEGMIEVIDEFYSHNLSQETKRGMRENARRGYLNGGVPPIGYTAKEVAVGGNTKRVLIPDAMYAPVIRRVFEMYVGGKGIKEIAKTLNEEGLKTNQGRSWSTSLIYNILKREVYTGTHIWRPTKGEAEEEVRIEDNHPALIEKKLFQDAQKVLQARSPKVRHPRTVSSQYLLSGLVRCAGCGAAWGGHSAKSGAHHYYACTNHIKKGKTVCDAKLHRKERLERFVIDRLKAHVLTEENLTRLLRLVNEELEKTKESSGEQLTILDKKLTDVARRLGKLYDALETGAFDMHDLAPRIKSLRAEQEQLSARRRDLVRITETSSVNQTSLAAVRAYASNLSELLGTGTVMEQKTFLRSFVRRIVVGAEEVKIEYTIPITKKKTEPLMEEVLSITSLSSPGRTRTYNPAVNSRMLYH